MDEKVMVADQSSSYTIVLAPPGTDRFVLHNPATNDTFGPEDVAGWSDRELWASTYKADNFRFALGAGDATIAGFLCALIRGYSPADSLNIANTVGWQNVQAIDALSGIGNWQTVRPIQNNCGG